MMPLRRFLPMKTSIKWPTSESVAARVRLEVYDQLAVDEDEEDFDMNVTFPGWNKEDSFCIIAGIMHPEDDWPRDWATQDFYNFPKFAHMARSSLDSELILRVNGEQTFPTFFPITAQELMVGF